ncbi:CidA/LrgA family protein [Acinetobacter soli]|uniref:CidA/LrgA family protein n=1 Tax=Acinetobacter soli TaxID=487316 RepID=UPI002813F328|nr:CidA/LrgA family protein [Acinetobacter soli]MDQ9832919.1 CidA/LrgA family protein [Acinetobacter soli]
MNSRYSVLAKISLQIGLLIMLWWIGSLIQKLFQLPISAGVIGLFLVLLGLLSGTFKLNWIKSGSDFILSELVLFFVPCVVGLMNYKVLFLSEGLQLITAVVLGTVCVMLATVYTVHLCFKLEQWLQHTFRFCKGNSKSESLS